MNISHNGRQVFDLIDLGGVWHGSKAVGIAFDYEGRLLRLVWDRGHARIEERGPSRTWVPVECPDMLRGQLDRFAQWAREREE